MNLLKEPLLHFLLIGAGLFLLYEWGNSPAAVSGGLTTATSTQIEVSWDTVERMSRQFELTWQRPPSDAERQGLIEEIVRNEIFYREAIAIGLDRDDEVLKRRLRQKMEFIYEDIATPAEPTDEELHIFLSRYRQKYFADHGVSFQQLYFNADKRGMNAEADAITELAQLREGASPDRVGDPTQLAAEVPLTPSWEIGRQSGEALSKRLLELETDLHPERFAGQGQGSQLAARAGWAVLDSQAHLLAQGRGARRHVESSPVEKGVIRGADFMFAPGAS